MSHSPRRLAHCLPPLLWLFFFAAHTAALFQTGTSPQVQGGLVLRAQNECPVSQDGATTNSFPWTHQPTCLPLVLPSQASPHVGTHRTFCVYTNAFFNNGRGISIVTSPDTAAELGNEVYEAASEVARNVTGIWEMKEVEAKGMGLFAKKEVRAGETLILETPVLVVSEEVLASVSRGRRRVLLDKAVQQLPEQTSRALKALSRRGGKNEVEDAINVNAVGARVWDGTRALMVVPEAARINHACRPNAYYRFNHYTLIFDVFALKPIVPGEEITFSYGYATEPHSSRTKALEFTWGFTCTCPLCTSSSSTLATSDSRLADIAAIKSSLPTSLDDIPQYIALLPRLITLLEEEGLLAELPMYEEILAYAWSAVKDEKKARYWGTRAVDGWGVLAGRDSWERRRCEELVEDVRAHYTWGVWEGDPWEGVGKGHPWDDDDGGHHHGDQVMR